MNVQKDWSGLNLSLVSILVSNNLCRWRKAYKTVQKGIHIKMFRILRQMFLIKTFIKPYYSVSAETFNPCASNPPF